MRLRSSSCAALAIRPLSRRSVSSRASMSLKAALSDRTSSSAPEIATRRPGSSGLTERIVSVRRRSGDTIRRSSTRLTASETTNPLTRMTDWVSVTG
jgi:hypothetical protein